MGMSACRRSSTLVERNMAHLYQQESVLLRPSLEVHHTSDTSSLLHFQIRSKELLFARTEESDTFYAHVSVHYRLYNSLEAAGLIDSGSVHIHKSAIELHPQLIRGEIEIRTDADAETAMMEIITRDHLRDFEYKTYEPISRVHDQSRQNFAVYDLNGSLCLDPYFQPGKAVQVDHWKPHFDSLYVRYYGRYFPLASPPYSIQNEIPFDYSADSVFRIAMNDTLRLDKRGFYHLQYDTTNTYGLTLFAFYDDFPYVTKERHMRPPMRYITTKKEYEALLTKKEVDDFWLRNAGSPDRARLLIRTYYNRVQDANVHFSSYLEGWKTDRGIVYTIFGPPNIIYKGSDGETWIYGEENSVLSYNFNFVRVENPFTNNDYALNRSSIYRYSWSQAVDTWRQGRVYNVTDVQRAQDETRQQYSQPYFWY
jgi:GWxTD domain-containing protein